LVFGILFVTFPFEVFPFISYLNIPAIIGFWILIVTGVILLIYMFIPGIKIPIVEKLPYIGLIIVIFELFLLVISVFPNAMTDEIAVSTFAAKLFLEGKDPYSNANMAPVFSTYFRPAGYTPTLFGGVMNTLIYPGMSVLVFIPVVLLKLPNYSMLLVFSMIAFAGVFYEYYKKKMVDLIPFLAVMIAIAAAIFGFSMGGTTDILWITFLIFAYLTRKNPWLSGIFFGLSLSSKQTPIVILPFFLYFMYKENGSKHSSIPKFIIGGAVSFMATNLPFILMSPTDWLRNVLVAAYQPIIGVGIGFSEPSFIGMVNIPSIFFTTMFVAVAIFFFIAYVRYFDLLKYAFFAFPMIIFLFNYRVFVNYIVDWTFLIFLIYPEYQEMFNKNIHHRKTIHIDIIVLIKDYKNFVKKVFSKHYAIAIALIVIFGLGTGGAYALSYENSSYSTFTINSITNESNPVGIPGLITQMSMNISYTPLTNPSNNSAVLFRLFPQNPIGGRFNGLLWNTNSTLHYGFNNITIKPTRYVDFLKQNETFRIEAYYGKETGFFNWKSPLLSNKNFTMDNWKMLYPTYVASDPFPGWDAIYNNVSTGYYNYSGINGINLSYKGTLNNTFSYYGIESIMNYSYLVNNNFSLSYNQSSNSSFASTKNMSGAKSFSGILISLNSGTEKIWITANKTMAGLSVKPITTDSRTNLIIIDNSMIINFSQLNSMLLNYTGTNYNLASGTISFIVGSGYAGTQVYSTFSSINLYR
ncbi:MAG: glycosyltransferase 87 family protein, partial [Thermoplasmataceae archaeon]